MIKMAANDKNMKTVRTMTDDDANKNKQVLQTYMILRGPLLFPHHVGPVSVGLQECFVLQFVYYNFITNHLFNHHYHHDPLPLVSKNVVCFICTFQLYQVYRLSFIIIIIIIIISTCMVVIPPTPPTTF